MISDSLFNKFYSDPKYDGTKRFYDLIRAWTKPDYCVLNLGAGPTTGKPVCSLKGEVDEVIGADIDPIVLENTELDGAFIIEDGRLPFVDKRFDLVFSDFVLEHVEYPDQFLSEVHRVLKPGGSYFIRTPNFYHYVSIISNFTPHWFHEMTANRVREMPKEAHDPWPTFYRLNTQKSVRTAAKNAGFKQVKIQMVENQPSYLVFHPIPFLAGVTYERLVNSTNSMAGLRANIFGQMIK